MLGTINTLLIDGSFEELADELAQYIDDLKKKQGETSNIHNEVAPFLEKGQQDEALKKLVTGSSALNAAPEKEFVAAYNLLVHLVRQAPSDLIGKCLYRICQNLANPVTYSPAHGSGLALTVLTTIFNILPHDDDTRYHVFSAILSLIKNTASFDNLKPQLRSLDSWIEVWETDEEDQRKLFLNIAAAADEAGEEEDGYFYLLRALRTFEADEADGEEAQSLSVRALKAALLQPRHFDFQDLTIIDSVQALRKSDAPLFELLEIFTSQGLEEYNEFKEEQGQWLAKQDLDVSVLDRKMRLLTLASLAAQVPNRTLPYQRIAQQLQVPSEDVEMWVIDVIRAGLVEGKLSQLNQILLIHRSTYRVFGEKQWTEVQGRLETWRNSLASVLSVVRQEREKVIREKERELKEMEGKLAGGNAANTRRVRDIDVGAD